MTLTLDPPNEISTCQRQPSQRRKLGRALRHLRGVVDHLTADGAVGLMFVGFRLRAPRNPDTLTERAVALVVGAVGEERATAHLRRLIRRRRWCSECDCFIPSPDEAALMRGLARDETCGDGRLLCIACHLKDGTCGPTVRCDCGHNEVLRYAERDRDDALLCVECAQPSQRLKLEVLR